LGAKFSPSLPLSYPPLPFVLIDGVVYNAKEGDCEMLAICHQDFSNSDGLYADGAGNITEENSSIFFLIQMC